MKSRSTKMIALCGEVGKEPHIYGIEIGNKDGTVGALLYQFRGCRDFHLEGCLRRSPNAQNHKPFTTQQDKTKKYTDISDTLGSGKHCEDMACTEKYGFNPGSGSPKDHEFDLNKAIKYLRGRRKVPHLRPFDEPLNLDWETSKGS